MVGTFLNVTGHIGMQGSPARVNDFETSFLILFVLGFVPAAIRRGAATRRASSPSRHTFGLMYVPWLTHPEDQFFSRTSETTAKFYVLYFVIVTKSATRARTRRSLIGKHKMIPRISPGKNMGVFGGAIAVSTAASLVVVHFLGPKLPGMNALHAVALGVV